MDRLEKELKRIQQRTSEMIRNLTSCHRNTFDNSVSPYPFSQNFSQFSHFYPDQTRLTLTLTPYSHPFFSVGGFKIARSFSKSVLDFSFFQSWTVRSGSSVTSGSEPTGFGPWLPLPTKPALTRLTQLVNPFLANEETTITTTNGEHMFKSRTYNDSNINKAIILCAERII